MMSNSSPLLIAALVVLLLTLGAGMVRALRGPSLADRMLAVQLLGTGGVGLLLLLSAAASLACSAPINCTRLASRSA